jgi:beta-phosphoglucomutase-like phosphatase (HAD superfamily)
MAVRAFLFDFDGLILDTESAAREGGYGCTASTGMSSRESGR